jgi:hypothetical protein
VRDEVVDVAVGGETRKGNAAVRVRPARATRPSAVSPARRSSDTLPVALGGSRRVKGEGRLDLNRG